MAKKKAKKKVTKVNTKELEFKDAFKYPFNRPGGMLNILWLLLPIIGWFPLFGYTIRIIKNFVKGDFKELPSFSFGSDFKLGFFMFFKSIPFAIVYYVILMATQKIQMLYILVAIFLGVFVAPVLTINFFKKETIGSYFEFTKLDYVFENIGDYLIAILKSIGLGLIFLVMMLVLVGIPASAFTKNIFLADFYRRKVK